MLCCAYGYAGAQPRRHSSDEVLVVSNSRSPASLAIASVYVRARHIKLRASVDCPDSALSSQDETISYDAYVKSIEEPIRTALTAHPGINFIVLTKGIPIRIIGAPSGSCDENSKEPEATRGHPSVDSMLSALDYGKLPGSIKLTITGSGATGSGWMNRYWGKTEPFSHKKFGGYLVTRFDAYTTSDCIALVNRSLQAEKTPIHRLSEESVLLDVQPAFGLKPSVDQPASLPPIEIKRESDYSEFNQDMIHAASILKPSGIPVELDLSETFVGDRTGLLGYFSWGSNDAKYSRDAYESLQFAPGSISDTAVSTSGRTFLPTEGGQSLLADLIAHGLTCGKGYSDEPLLQAIASPTITLQRYTAGFTMAESLYSASHFVGWEDVVIGDPLCAPFLKH